MTLLITSTPTVEASEDVRAALNAVGIIKQDTETARIEAIACATFQLDIAISRGQPFDCILIPYVSYLRRRNTVRGQTKSLIALTPIGKVGRQ